MKIHLVTIGKPKLAYAQAGWEEYISRLKHFHQLRITHIPDKHNTAPFIITAIGNASLVALVIDEPQYSSHELANFLETQALSGREVCFVIGGPDGLMPEVIARADKTLGLSKLTFPHDLAMVILAEALYRASTINAGQPYHR